MLLGCSAIALKVRTGGRLTPNCRIHTERMNEFLPYYYKVNPTTWAYVSSLLMIGLYFKFSRFWSVRNLDLILLILLAPGLLLVSAGEELYRKAQVTQAAAATDIKAGETVGTNDEDVESNLTPVETVPTSTVDEPVTGAPPSPPADEVPTEDKKRSNVAHDPMGEIMSDFAEPVRAVPSAADLQLQTAVRTARFGYLWLFIAGGLLMVRLLLDATMVRRPLLEPNLSPGGLTFLGASLFVFLMGNLIATPVEATAPQARNRPGFALIQELPSVPRNDFDSRPSPTEKAPLENAPPEKTQASGAALSKIVVILAHLAIIVAMIVIGYRHFDNMKMGVGAATLYLMLPYSAEMTGMPQHAVPAAFLMWAVLCYRRPLTAGLFMGVAAAVGYYPLFLLPLWISFYWQRGLKRFVSGVLTMLLTMALLLIFEANSFSDYILHLQAMFGALPFRMTDLGGIWGLGWDPVYRIPMLTAFVALAFSFALWPAQKNLGTLLSCSAAVMLAAQFWHGDGGGLYMAWYLPLLLLTIFRPNLEDRVALSVLGEGWFPRRRAFNGVVDRAAFKILDPDPAPR